MIHSVVDACENCIQHIDPKDRETITNTLAEITEVKDNLISIVQGRFNPRQEIIVSLEKINESLSEMEKECVFFM